MEFNFFKSIFGKKEEEIQPIEEEIQEEKNKNLTQILSEELKKTERMNIRFSTHTLNLIKEKIQKITKQKDLTNSEMINFIVAHFLSDENEDKEPLKILSEDKKKYKLTFKLTREEIEYIFNICIEKNIYIDESCFQIAINGINKNAKNKIYQLLMGEIHGLSDNQEEKKFLENMKELKEINRRIIELKNYEFYNLIKKDEIREKYEEIIKEIAEMSDKIKQISSFFKRI